MNSLPTGSPTADSRALAPLSYDRIPRRGLLGVSGFALGVAPGGPADAQNPVGAAAPPALTTRPYAEALRRHTLEVREACARFNAEVPVPPLPDNGDEARYLNKIGSDTRGLPHNTRGEVDPAAWRVAEAAYRSDDPAAFERIPLAGPRKQPNPLASLAANLSGLCPSQVAAPPAPALASAARGAEAVEVYWQSLLRDVPFAAYVDDTGHRDVIAAVEELNRLADFHGPRVEGRVTPRTLFRGNALYVDRSDPTGQTGRWVTPPGVLDGPMISQFLYRDTPYGSQSMPARIRTSTPASEFLIDYDEWLRVQNGGAPSGRNQFDPVHRFIACGRDLGTYSHVTPPAVSWAAALQLGLPAPEATSTHGGIFPGTRPALAPSNPYLRSRTQAGGSGSFGLPYFQSVVALATARGPRVSVWHKYWVHLTLRPEAFGGLLHHRLAHGVQDYPLHETVLASRALERSRAKHGSHLLAQMYPEGAPMHPAYPGSASIGAATGVTLLKAFFDEAREFPNPVQPAPNDPARLVPYAGPPLTVGGELNKLATNYGLGRNWAGIHWRSDAAASMTLGEELAISILRDESMSLREAFDGFSFTRFDGSRATV